jgi:aminopeptidase I
MARLTSNSVRNRVSNLSLRSAAEPSSQLSGPTLATASHDPSSHPNITPSINFLNNRNTDTFLAFGSERESLQHIKDICRVCGERLPDGKILRVSRYEDSKECRMCKLRAAKPEAFTQPFCDFLTENPTVFHAVDYFKRAAFATGYKEVKIAAD